MAGSGGGGSGVLAGAQAAVTCTATGLVITLVGSGGHGGGDGGGDHVFVEDGGSDPAEDGRRDVHPQGAEGGGHDGRAQCPVGVDRPTGDPATDEDGRDEGEADRGAATAAGTRSSVATAMMTNTSRNVINASTMNTRASPTPFEGVVAPRCAMLRASLPS